MLKITVLVSGGGTNLQAIIDAIDAGRITNAHIEAVISNNKNAYALTRAKNHGIPAIVLSPKDFAAREDYNRALVETIDGTDCGLIVLAGCMVILPPELIRKYENRIINIHPALIPSFCGTGYYGLKVHEAALARGVKVTGATCHFVDEGTDTGPIILQKAVEVREGDTPKTLQLRVMEEAEWQIMPEAINLIANGRVTVEDGRVLIRQD
ncbi:MAG: phosphoribosylglycinamide formyltransferase [Lachnospiraceae bacterium]|nr:phosphoribosylglycinamide formyltransferase [Lachnospiraceae bacterium]